MGVGALAVVLIIAVLAVFAPVFAPADPLAQDYDALLTGPSGAHLFGTDQVGRDLLSRIIYGARISLVVGLISVGIAIIIGVPLGLLSGYVRGTVDEVVMRVMDALIAFPSLILALAIVALFARLTRSQVLSLRERDFIGAARALGATDWRIMLRHILPNALSPIIVQGTLGLGFAVLSEAGLGYLGVGVQPPTPTWGSSLNQGAPLLERAPWLSFFPGLAIFVLVLAFNLLGDALRDQLDPHLRGR
jgi:peptide/nickel transport system permease protein